MRRVAGLLLMAPFACVQTGTSGAGAGEAGDGPFMEIALQCPDAAGGVLEFTQGNRLGQKDRITIVYDGDVAVRLEAATAERGEAMEAYFSSDNPETEADADRKEFADALLAKYGSLRRGVCLAPDRERERYFRMLDRQRKLVPS